MDVGDKDRSFRFLSYAYFGTLLQKLKLCTVGQWHISNRIMLSFASASVFKISVFGFVLIKSRHVSCSPTLVPSSAKNGILHKITGVGTGDFGIAFRSSWLIEHLKSKYFATHGNLSSVYYQGNEDGNMIDLGLSLKTLQPQAYHPSGHEDYGDLIDWQQLHPQLRSSNYEYTRNVTYDSAEETDGVQSKSRCAYVKVNMDGVIVGRKICVFDHSDYSSLAMQLEDMFGRQSLSGLRLFQVASEFCLFYKDRDEQWRTAGDVPWREFVDCVKRMRIVHKNEAGMSSSASFP